MNKKMNYNIHIYGSSGGIMKSITIHGIDSDLDKKIAEKSKEYGLSQNRTVKYILQTTLLKEHNANRKEAFSDLFGKWTLQDKNDFENRTKDLERVDESDWKNQ
jgi:hypothetical protein